MNRLGCTRSRLVNSKLKVNIENLQNALKFVSQTGHCSYVMGSITIKISLYPRIYLNPFEDIRQCILRIKKLEDLFSELDVHTQKYAVRSLYCTPIIDRHFKISDFCQYAASVGLRNHTEFEVSASYQYISRFPKSKALLTASTLDLFEDKDLGSDFKENIVEAVVYQVLFNSALKGLNPPAANF